jgi:hypothetical protein
MHHYSLCDGVFGSRSCCTTPKAQGCHPLWELLVSAGGMLGNLISLPLLEHLRCLLQSCRPCEVPLSGTMLGLAAETASVFLYICQFCRTT